MKKNLLKCCVALAALLGLLLSGCKLEVTINRDDYSTGAEDDTPKQTKPPKDENTDQTDAPDDTETQETQGNQTVTQPPVGEERTDCAYIVRAKGGLNVRTGPGTQYDTAGGLEDGEIVYPLRWVDHWAYIEGRLTGWCTGEFLEPIIVENEYVTRSQWVAKDTQMYQGPGYNYSTLGECRLSYGLQVYPQRWEGEWAYLEIQHYDMLLKGWVNAKDLCQSDPEPIRRPEQFLTYKAPAYPPVVGQWVVVSEYGKVDGIGASCWAGVLTLYTDGTFEHWMSPYAYSVGALGWYSTSNAGEINRNLWVGEYTQVDHKLILTYLGMERNEGVTDTNGYFMPVSVHWYNFQKQVTLDVSGYEDTLYVNQPEQIPIKGLDAQGSLTTEPVLYRMRSYQNIFDILKQYYW